MDHVVVEIHWDCDLLPGLGNTKEAVLNSSEWVT